MFLSLRLVILMTLAALCTVFLAHAATAQDLANSEAQRCAYYLRDGSPDALRQRLALLLSEVEEAERGLAMAPGAAVDFTAALPVLIEEVSQRSSLALAHAVTNVPRGPYELRVIKISAQWSKTLRNIAPLHDAERRISFDDNTGLYLIRQTQLGLGIESSKKLLERNAIIDVRIEDGLFVDTKGRPLTIDTNKVWIFAWNMERKLRITTKTGVFHSDLFPGENVAMAGELQLVAGKLVSLSDQSGHFAPPRLLMQQFLRWLASQNVSAPDARYSASEGSVAAPGVL